MKKKLLKKTGLLIAVLGLCTSQLSAQTTLTAGDIAIVGFKEVNTNVGAVAFILLKDITSGTKITITNRSWLSDQTGFTGAYGVDDTYTWTAGGAFAKGTILRLESDNTVKLVTGGAATTVGTTVAETGTGATAGFNLVSSNTTINDASNAPGITKAGDSVLIFQYSGGTFAYPTSGDSTAWIAGLKTGIPWGAIVSGTANSFSALPTALSGAGFNLYIGDANNGAYNGEILGSASNIRAKTNLAANWTTNLDNSGTLSGVYKLWSYAETNGTDFGQIGKSGTLAVRNFELDNAISVYPNPTANYVSINLGGNELTKASLTNVSGAIVLSSSATTIDLSSLSAGVYFLKIETAKGSTTKKIVKQ
ncbi:T9SS type A sorting domain-containing protein [Flavobacterium ovatum]|uniref:T9SS type A sorting domain-containing protein n=1 Tax=Flavobacterium ovatum TaxID=1928857 RepID=UPI00344CF130